MKKNVFLIGDNREIMGTFDSGAFDFIYMDPPYNTGRNFGHFEDKWSSSADYKEFMRPVIEQSHRLLGESGNIAIHVEPKISHHIKSILDDVFGEKNYRNTIVWKTGGNKKTSHYLPRRHDEIIVYSKNKNKNPTFHPQYQPYDEEYKKRNSVKICPTTKREYVTSACHNAQPNVIVRENLRYEWNGHEKQWWWSKELMQQRHDEGRLAYNANGIPRVKKYLDEMSGIPLSDVWTDVTPPSKKEKLDYATQKPVLLLERLLKLYSGEGSLVLDPFAGSGTTGRAALNLGRNYVLLDINDHGKAEFEKSISEVDLKSTTCEKKEKNTNTRVDSPK